MKRYSILLITTALAVAIAIGLTLRVLVVKRHFDKVVKEALRTSEGYDQKFIDMVNRLEEELATRASFGYGGGKDPMTGTTRMVVQQKPVPLAPATRPAAPSHSGPAIVEAPVVPAVAVDPVKLTAIIGDTRNITAIIMDGERSYSVGQGDNVAGRKITRVTNEGVYMEDELNEYFYDIGGNKIVKPLEK